MTKIQKEQKKEIRTLKNTDKQSIVFMAIGNNKANLQKFALYCTQLPKNEVRNVKVVYENGVVYYTSRFINQSKGRVCYNLSLKARELGIVLPQYITQCASSYRWANNLPRLYKKHRKSSNSIVERVKSKLIINKTKRKYTRKSKVTFWGKLVNLFKAQEF